MVDEAQASAHQPPDWPLVTWAALAGSGLLVGVFFLLLSPPTLGSMADGLVLVLVLGLLAAGLLLHLLLWLASRGSEPGFGWHPFFLGGTLAGTLLWGLTLFYGGNMWLPGKGRPPIETVELPVLDKTIRKRGRSVAHLIHMLDPFDLSEALPRTIELDARTLIGGRLHWERFEIGQCAELAYRTGHFGLPIRAGLQPRPCSAARGQPPIGQRPFVEVPDYDPAGWRWLGASQPPGSSSELSP